MKLSWKNSFSFFAITSLDLLYLFHTCFFLMMQHNSLCHISPPHRAPADEVHNVTIFTLCNLASLSLILNSCRPGSVPDCGGDAPEWKRQTARQSVCDFLGEGVVVVTTRGSQFCRSNWPSDVCTCVQLAADNENKVGARWCASRSGAFAVSLWSAGKTFCTQTVLVKDNWLQ